MFNLPSILAIAVGIGISRPQWNPTEYRKQFTTWSDWVKFAFILTFVLTFGTLVGFLLVIASGYPAQVGLQFPLAIGVGMIGGKTITAWRVHKGELSPEEPDEGEDGENQENDDRTVEGTPPEFPEDGSPDRSSRGVDAGINVLERCVQGQGNFDVPQNLAEEAEITDVIDKNPKRYIDRKLRVDETVYEEELPPSTFHQRKGGSLREDFHDRENVVPTSFSSSTYSFLVPNSETRATCSSCAGSGRTDCGTCRGSGKDTCSTCSGNGQVTEQDPCSSCNGQGGNSCRSCGGSGETTTREVCSACNGNRKQLKTCRTCGGDGRNQQGTLCGQCLGDGEISVNCESCSGSGKRETMTNCSSCGGSGQNACRTCGGEGYTEYQAQCSECIGSGRVTCSTCDGAGKVTCSTCDGECETITFENAKRSFTPSESVVYEALGVPVEILDGCSSITVDTNPAYTDDTVVKHEKVTERVPITEVSYEYAGNNWEVFDPKQDNTIQRLAGPENVLKELKLLAVGVSLFLIPLLALSL